MSNNAGSGLAGEQVLIKNLRPHPLAFAGEAALWVYTIIVALAVYAARDTLAARVAGLPVVGGWLADHTGLLGPLALIGAAVLVPVLVYSLFRVSWRPLAASIVAVVVAPALAVYGGYGLRGAVAGIVGVSILGLLSVELKRRKHSYTITTRRVITEYKGLFGSSRREVVYSRLSDVIVEKGLLGKIFGYGNVYLISQAGMGMGADHSALTVGAGASAGPAAGGVAVTGGKSVNVPASRSQYILYAVPNPEDVASKIVEAMGASEEAPYLQKIVEKLDKLDKSSG